MRKSQAPKSSPWATDSDAAPADPPPATAAAPFAVGGNNDHVAQTIGSKPGTSGAKIGHFKQEESKENYEYHRAAAAASKARNRNSEGIFC